MKNLSKNFNVSKKTYIILLFVVVILQLSRLVFTFAFYKQDYHSDEPWSFGLANGYYQPYIFQDADETMHINEHEWVSGDIFKEYLTVNKDQRFRYDSVFYNQSKDLHPPLYFLILHTICSLFPQTFSYWYGFIVNIIAFIVTQLFLFKLIKEITNKEAVAIAGCILYGTSVGAVNTFIFIRMYALLTMFTVITSYLHIRMYNDKNIKKNLPAIFVVTVLGCLTHHFFLLYAGVLAACFCFYYLFNKEFKSLFIYATVLLAAAGTSVLIFPATINHLFGRRGKIVKYTMDWQLRYCFNFALSELFSIHVSVFHSPKILLSLMIILVCVIIIAPLHFLFRKELWYKKIKSSISNKIFNFIKEFKNKIHFFNFPILFMFISALSGIIGTACTVSVIDMMYTTDRYMFFIYPILCASVIAFVYYIFKWIFKNTSLTSICITLFSCIVCIICNINVPVIYTFTQTPGSISSSEFSELVKDQDCLIIFDNTATWLSTCFSDKIMYSDNVYITSFDYMFDIHTNSDGKEILDELENLDIILKQTNKSKIYLICSSDIFEKSKDSSNLNMRLGNEQMGQGYVVNNKNNNNTDNNNNNNNNNNSNNNYDKTVSEEMMLDAIEKHDIVSKIEEVDLIEVFLRKYYIYSVELNT